MYDCERYKITFMDEGVVEIEGEMTSLELIESLKYLDSKDYNSVSLYDGSIRLKNRNFEEEQLEFIKNQHLENEKFYESQYQNEKKRSEELLKKVNDLEGLIKNITQEHKKNELLIKDKIYKLEKENIYNKLDKNPLSLNIMKNSMTEEEKN